MKIYENVLSDMYAPPPPPTHKKKQQPQISLRIRAV